jgi:hypothetical protein
MDDGRSVAEAFDSGTRNFSDVMRLLEDASLQLSNARTMSGVIEKGARRTEYLSLLVRAFVAFRGAPRRRWYSRRAFLCDYSENARDRDTNVSGSRPTAGVRTSPDGRHATGTIGIWLGIAGTHVAGRVMSSLLHNVKPNDPRYWPEQRPYWAAIALKIVVLSIEMRSVQLTIGWRRFSGPHSNRENRRAPLRLSHGHRECALLCCPLDVHRDAHRPGLAAAPIPSNSSIIARDISRATRPLPSVKGCILRRDRGLGGQNDRLDVADVCANLLEALQEVSRFVRAAETKSVRWRPSGAECGYSEVRRSSSRWWMSTPSFPWSETTDSGECAWHRVDRVVCRSVWQTP